MLWISAFTQCPEQSGVQTSSMDILSSLHRVIQHCAVSGEGFLATKCCWWILQRRDSIFRNATAFSFATTPECCPIMLATLFVHTPGHSPQSKASAWKYSSRALTLSARVVRPGRLRQRGSSFLRSSWLSCLTKQSRVALSLVSVASSS